MSTLRINWGTRILFLYLGFVALIVTLVYSSMQQDFDLVAKDYYDEELKYQEVIDAGKNQAALSAPVGIKQTGKTVQLKFPAEFVTGGVNGTVQFYSTTNASLDRHYKIATAGNSVTYIDITDLTPSAYTAKLKWEADGKSYYQETLISITP